MAAIRYVQRSDIDTQKWDQCINASANGLIYAYSFYLDNMCRNWDALIAGDYEQVMPLAWNKKWGIKYLYHPAFVQQLGVFSVEELSLSRIYDFLGQTQHYFRFAEIFLNYRNPVSLLSCRTNYILSLSDGYTAINGAYKQDMVRNLKHAAGFSLTYTREVDLKEALQGFREAYADKIVSIKSKEYHRFEQLCLFANDKGELILRGVLNENRTILATALLLKKKNRMYLLQSVTYHNGREVSANHFLLDNIIREFSGSGIILDFEGSDQPGISHFYRNFGAVDQPYFFYRFNLLPWWIKWLK